MVSMMLAMPVAAQRGAAGDSLALQTLNSVLHLVPGPLSIDLSLGQLTSRAPKLVAVGSGYTHIIMRDTARHDLQVSFLFRREAGVMFSPKVSRRARLVELELIRLTDSAPRLKPHMALFDRIATQLGPPEFCNRDTAVLAADNGISASSFASWRRGTILVTMSHSMNYIEFPRESPAYTRRFDLSLRFTRTTDPWPNRDMPTRHDSPCLLTWAEFMEHEHPLGDAAFRALREQLRQRAPQRPPGR